jgi:hypothetical protein
MLSADPIINSIYNTQAYNRFSYVWNNPLKFVDTDGYDGRFVQWIKNLFSNKQTDCPSFGDIKVNDRNHRGEAGRDGNFGKAFGGWLKGFFGTGEGGVSLHQTNGYNAPRSIALGVYSLSNNSFSFGSANFGSELYGPWNIPVAQGPPGAASSKGVTPFQVGVEWLTGTGPRHRDFTNGDVFTEMLRQHENVLNTLATIPEMIANGIMRGNAPYSLSGIQGVGKYLKDYSTLATGGLTGNLAVTYLGSYNLAWKVTEVNGNSATVEFLVNNSSTIQSATRPPVLAYYSWWQNSVGSWINSSISSGPMSPTTQTFRWIETVRW